ncbi:MAG TPA: hypothetical protein VES40_03735, partial [Ilumatobacteraceae bacterium]|nr:hypothetical protein [Ilumatobacteraceae bacterium]
MSDPAVLRNDWRDVPHPKRLPNADPQRAEILKRHGTALENGFPVYTDPTSALSVFTSDFLAR